MYDHWPPPLLYDPPHTVVGECSHTSHNGPVRGYKSPPFFSGAPPFLLGPLGGYAQMWGAAEGARETAPSDYPPTSRLPRAPLAGSGARVGWPERVLTRAGLVRHCAITTTGKARRLAAVALACPEAGPGKSRPGSGTRSVRTTPPPLSGSPARSRLGGRSSLVEPRTR